MIGVSFIGFEGPFDLLLDLVRKNEYTFDQIPLTEITRQFIGCIQEPSAADIELGGEFIEIASWLVLLKSRSLLPPTDSQLTAEEELYQTLTDYAEEKAKARRTAEVLRSLLSDTGLSSGYVPPREQSPSGAEVSELPPTLLDALTSARNAANAARAHEAIAPIFERDVLTVEKRLAAIRAEMDSLPAGSVIDTATWFAQDELIEARVVLFLTLLELTRLQQILIHQPDHCMSILLKKV